MSDSTSEEMVYVVGPESQLSHFTGIETETEHWSAKKWSDTIMNRDIVERSSTKLDTRLEEFLKEAQPADQKIFEESRSKVLKIIKDAKAEQEARYPGLPPRSERTLAQTVKSTCREASETAYDYVQILDIMVGQFPEFVALAYGAVKILLVASVNHQEMKQNVETYLLKIKTKFDMIDHLTCYIPTARLVDGISRLYDLFYRFIGKALKFYTRSRLKHAFNSVLRPWKRLEPLVTLIEQTFMDVKDIVQFHGHITGEMNLIVSQKIMADNQKITSQMKRMLDILEELPVKFSKPDDVPQMRDLLRQRVDENLSDLTTKRGQVNGSKKEEDTTSKKSTGEEPNSEITPDIDQLLEGLFVELHEYDDFCAQQQRVLEQLPEMRPHRSKQRNILKVDNVMSWIESPSSKLLWIDGNNLLQRHDFNASFAVPLILLGESTCETYLILRHFCGDNDSTPSTGYKTLIQSLLRQLFKQHPTVWKKKASLLTRDRLSDIKHLWALFLECVKEVNAQCTFIVIDSVDCLDAVSSKESGSFDEGEFILNQLNDLIKDSTLVVKVLLTAALTQDPPIQPKGQSALVAYKPVPVYQHRRKPSLDEAEDEFVLYPQKLIEIQEKRCKSILFTQLPMIYQINSTIYTYEDGKLRAFVVAELSGMDARPFSTYSPLQIRAWAIDHNGKYFTKRYHNFVVSQFPGERDVSTLMYIPSGYLTNESEHRAKLLERGKMYWKLSNDVRHQQYVGVAKTTRIIVDQYTRPIELLDREEDQLNITLCSDLKPLTLIVCPPHIDAFILSDLKWTKIPVDDIEDIKFMRNPFDRLVLEWEQKELLISALEPHATDNADRNLMTLSHDASIILLRGDDGGKGLGKTLSTIYAAEHIQRPLLSVSPGNLGNTQAEVAANLQTFLRLAKHWKAVFVLEDADVVLKQRRREEAIQDSTAITTFMLDLENYPGIIIVTSNCPLNIDMAFTDRVQISIQYGRLKSIDRETLWRKILAEFDVDTNEVRDGLTEFLTSDNSRRFWQASGHDIHTWVTTAIRLAKLRNEPFNMEILQMAMNKSYNFQYYMASLRKSRKNMYGEHLDS